jgi:hypothetical protein
LVICPEPTLLMKPICRLHIPARRARPSHTSERPFAQRPEAFSAASHPVAQFRNAASTGLVPSTKPGRRRGMTPPESMRKALPDPRSTIVRAIWKHPWGPCPSCERPVCPDRPLPAARLTRAAGPGGCLD